MTTATTPLARIVERARGLYSLPAVAVRVLELTNNPRVDTARLKECIENDPAMTAKILRTVNSSVFGLPRKVTDLNQALALLGIKPLKMLVLGFSLPQELLAGIESEVLDLYWQNSLTRAVAARQLAAELETAGDEAFIAGLLCDVGMLVLLQDLGPTYAEFLLKARDEGADLPALEINALGFDHAVLSGRLLDHWGLPEILVRAISATRHARELDPPTQQLYDVLRLAQLLTEVVTTGSSEALSRFLDDERFAEQRGNKGLGHPP